MNRLTLSLAVAAAMVLALGNAASARLGMAPLAAPQDDAVIQVRGGHGHGHHGHGHRGRGHHYGWYRGRGHHWGHRHRYRHWH
jgi:hypothetical protein